MTDCFQDNVATIRLFAAIIPDEDVVQRMIDAITPVRKESWAKQVRWTPLDNIHITLRFFGDTLQKQYVELETALRDICRKTNGFELNLSSMIFLPSPRKTRVIGSSITPCPALDDLAQQIEQAAMHCGFEPERKRFMGHMTLGRCKNLDLRHQKTLCDVSNICMKVDRMDLVQSTLTPKGAVYESLITFGFLA